VNERNYPGLRARWALVPLFVALLWAGAGAAATHADSAPAGKLVFAGADGIYVQRMDGSAAQRIWTAPAGGAGVGPRWSPDGRTVAFVSDREERKELWLIPADFGEARRLTHGSSDVSQHAWSPDGERLVYVTKTDRPASDDPTHAPKEGSDVRVITQLGYKMDGEGFWDGRYKHLFTVPITSGGATPKSG